MSDAGKDSMLGMKVNPLSSKLMWCSFKVNLDRLAVKFEVLNIAEISDGGVMHLN